MVSENRHPSEAPFLAGDSIRALGASLVLVFHAAYGAAIGVGRDPALVGDTATSFGSTYGGLGPLLETFPLAIYIFFSLSGYLLSRRFLRAYVEGAPRPSIASYLRNRVLRIVPAFWFVFGLVLIRYGTLGSSPAEIAAVPLFVHVYDPGPITGVIGHLWTVGAEWGLYLALPLAALLVPGLFGARFSPAGRMRLVLFLVATVFLASVAFRALGPNDVDFQRLIPAVFWSFLPGVGLAALELVVPGRLRGARWGPALAYGLAGAWLASVILWVTLDVHSTAARAVVASVATTLALAAPLVLQWSRGRCWRILYNRPLRWIGQRSYSFYLVHGLVGLEVIRLLPAQGDVWRDLALTLPLAYVLTLAVAAVIYRLVEAPMLRLKSRRGRSGLDHTVPEVSRARPIEDPVTP